MVRFHPTNNELVGFVEGIAAPNEAILVAAHCDMCELCNSKLAGILDRCAESALGQPSANGAKIDNEFGNMLDAIVSRPQTPLKIKQAKTSSTLCIDGKIFKIPTSLHRFASKVDSWSHLVGKLWQAPVSIGGKNIANFIYMEKGGSVPEHTHIGNEFTLVLNGSFSDGINEYKTGDFIVLNQTNTHMPVANGGEGCLVFSIIDEPLHFTSGWARLINPLSHLYFKVSTNN